MNRQFHSILASLIAAASLMIAFSAYPQSDEAALARAQAMSPEQIQAIPPEQLRKIPAEKLRRYATPELLAKLSPEQRQVIAEILAGKASQVSQKVQQEQESTEDKSRRDVQQVATTSSTLRRFGDELFTGAPSTFAPVTDIPVPVDYILGPGDTVEVQLFGNQNNQFSMTVQRDGYLQFPSFGPIQVAGLTFDSMRQLLLNRISKQMIGTEASITLGALRSIQVFVTGDVRRPGAYTVSSLSKMLNALFVSGGIAGTGSFRRVQLKRAGHLVTELDLYDLLLKGDTSKDAQLRPNDVIFVPPVGKTVAVTGAVLRPAVYEMRGAEKLSDLVNYAGGLIPTAYPKLTKIERIGSNGKRIVLDADPGEARGNLLLGDGDTVSIPTVLDELDNLVLLEGHVNREQPFQWRAGLRISDVVPAVDDLQPVPDLDYALLIRSSGKDRRLSVISFRPREIFAQPHGAQDLLLEPRDRLKFFGLGSKRAGQLAQLLAKLKQQARSDLVEPVVGIQGEVQEPGEYPLTADMSLRDIVLASIGLTKSADVRACLVVRREPRQKRIHVLQVSLDPANADLSSFKMQPSDTVLVFSKSDPRQPYIANLLATLKQQATPDQPAQIFNLNGEVKFPGEYPLPEGMNLQKAIALGGGLAEPAYQYSYEITRQNNDPKNGFKIENIELHLDDLSGAQESVYALQARDTLVVRRQSEYQEYESIELHGEVKFPGIYRAYRGEMLSDVIERAGGLTSFADAKGSVFTRATLRKSEESHLAELRQDLERDIARISVSSKDNKGSEQKLAFAEKLSERLSKTRAVGRLVIDLPAILRKDANADVQVLDGDNLYIPRQSQEVTVLGEVQFPTSHRFRPGTTVRDYINLSGGFAATADDDRVYVIRANGEVIADAASGWFGSEKIYAGDTVVVPLDLDPVQGLQLTTNIAQIVSQLAITAASLKAVGAF